MVEITDLVELVTMCAPPDPRYEVFLGDEKLRSTLGLMSKWETLYQYPDEAGEVPVMPSQEKLSDGVRFCESLLKLQRTQ